jgi:hypothetical protein
MDKMCGRFSFSGVYAVRMPFGKYKGEQIHDLPDDYLYWILENIEDLSDRLLNAICEALGEDPADYQPSTHRPPPPPPKPPSKPTSKAISQSTAKRIIDAGRRSLAKTCHPDAGGNAEEMIQINATADWLLERIAVSLPSTR